MYALTVVSQKFTDLGGVFHTLANTASDAPLIGNWASSPFYDAANYFYRISINVSTLNNWVDSTSSSMADFLTWDGVRLKVLGAWPGLSDLLGTIRATAWDHISGLVSGLSDLPGTIRATAWDWISGLVPGLSDLPGTIRSTAWDYISERLWDFLEFAAPKVARTAYRVLSFVWNLEWDDDKKEVKS